MKVQKYKMKINSKVSTLLQKKKLMVSGLGDLVERPHSSKFQDLYSTKSSKEMLQILSYYWNDSYYSYVISMANFEVLCIFHWYISLSPNFFFLKNGLGQLTQNLSILKQKLVHLARKIILF